jgi:pSer/pThr/pTyr-binding forkhead associated (FHA) protein
MPHIDALPKAALVRAGVESIHLSPDEPMLVVIEGEAPGKRVAIGSAPVIIGRGADVDLQVVDPTVSRYHCVVWRAAGRCWIRDLGSTNQTRVNNRSARVMELFDGDAVVMGQTIVTVASRRRRSDSASRLGSGD